MTLEDAAYALDELAASRAPDPDRTIARASFLGSLVTCCGREQALHDAAATLQLLVATGGTVDMFATARTRAGAMADAIRRVIEHG